MEQINIWENLTKYDLRNDNNNLLWAQKTGYKIENYGTKVKAIVSNDMKQLS